MGQWRVWIEDADGAWTIVGAGEANDRPRRVFVRAGGRPTRAEWTALMSRGAPQSPSFVVDLDDPVQVAQVGDPETW